MAAPVRVNYKQGDRMPPLDAILEEGPSGARTRVDLTGCTVRFIMRALGSATTKVAAAAVVMDADDGEVRYSWGSTDLDTAGSYRGEFEVTDADGKKRTFPSEDYIAIRVWDDMDI